MKNLPNLDVVKPSLETAKKALLLLGANPNLDAVASALALALVLKKRGIDVQVASLADMRVEFNRLVGIDQVRKRIGNKNLVITLDFKEENLEKVSYAQVEGGQRISVVITPKAGAMPPQPEGVVYDFAGAEADFIATFGVGSFAELGEFYENERTVYDFAMTTAFTLFPATPFMKCHFEAAGMSSLCELTALFCAQLGLELDGDAATNLIAGIDGTTQGFRLPTVTPDTFEVIADLMRSGGKRQPPMNTTVMSPNQMPFMPSQPSFMQQPMGNGGIDPFAQALGNAQTPPPSMPTPPAMPQFPGEFKG